MANSLYQALGGVQPSIDQAAPAPAAPAAPGAGSLFKDLLPQNATLPGSEPLQMGPQIADASDMQQGMRNAFGYHPSAPQIRPPVKSGSSAPSAPSKPLSQEATDFFNRMKGS